MGFKPIYIDRNVADISIDEHTDTLKARDDAIERLKKELQEKQEELEVQNEELEVQNEELAVQLDELREAHESLQKSEEARLHLAAIVESSEDGIIGMRLDGTITSWNKGAFKIYGYTQDEVLGRNITILLPQDRPDDLSGIIRRIHAGEHVDHYETIRVKKSGEEIFVSLSVSPIFDYNSKVVGASSIARDITESKRIENALRKSKAILDRAQSIAHVGNWALDLSLKTIKWSDEGFRTFGYSPQEFQPTFKWMLSRVYPEDRELVQNAIDQAINDGRLFNIDYRIVLPDGSIRYVNSVADKIRNAPDGKPKWVYGISQDITLRKKVENELIEAKSQAELYLDLMGHDINNLNQIALGYLEMAREEIEDDKAAVYITKPLDAIKRSSALIDNLKKLQLLKTSGLKIEAIDLGEMLSGLQARYSKAPDRDVIVSFEPVHGCHIMANGLIEDVFSNLIWNSIKHSGSNSQVNINIGLKKLTEGGKNVYRVDVEDDGPGISNEMKKKLFTRYQRGSTPVLGRGLGLYLVKALVEDFHGKVWMEDRVPGDHTKGARFVVVLPAACKNA